MSTPLSSRPYGNLPDGRPVTAHTLVGAGGLALEVLDYGGIVTRLLAPDRAGRLEDLVLGFSSLTPYLARHPYFGAITGRVAGRIPGAHFTLDGQLHELAANDGPHHIHGGLQGFDRRLWSATATLRPDGSPALRLAYRSPHGEEGYPGNADVVVTYCVTNDNAFVIEAEAASDRATPLNLTHHSYFNLAGEDAGGIGDHELQLLSISAYAPTDEKLIFLGRREALLESNAFTRPRRLAEAIPGLFKAHGDVYFVERPAASGPSPVTVARVSHPASGRVLTLSTTEDCLQFYTGCHLDGTCTGKSGRAYGKHAGFCLECQGFTGALTAPSLGDIILRPGQTRRHTTVYRFSNDAS
jgi:aldose 1-epimerase